MDEPIGPPQHLPEDPVARPGGPKVYGVLSIVFASLTFVMTLFSGCMTIASQRGDGGSWMYKGMKNPEERARIYRRFADRTRPATVTHTGVYAVMSAALLIIGIGQLRYRRWARKLSVYWGAVALASLALNIALSLIIVGPANEQLFVELQQVSKGMEAAMNSMFGSWAASPWMLAGAVIFYAPYPILLMITFSRGRAREAMLQ